MVQLNNTITRDGVAGVGLRPPVPGARLMRAVHGARIQPVTALWVVVLAILILPIAVFLVVAVSPKLLDQGTEWFTLSAFTRAFTGATIQGFLDSLGIGLVTAVIATGIGFGLAWILLRTDAPARKITTGLIFALFLTPSYLIALGWERLLEPNGVMQVLGMHPEAIRSVIYGPAGVVIVLTVKGIPFAYLAIANALRGLGREHEDAVRVHGGSPITAARMVLALIGPAVWSALAIVFAESVSDFGVASTLANAAHFPVATYTLYTAVQAFPVDFPLASAVSWMLMALVVVALLLQNRALKGRSYRVLSARNRPARITELSRTARVLWLVAFVALIATSLGIPILGAVSASLIDGLGTLAGSHKWDLSNYQRVLSSPSLGGALVYSTILAATTATIAIGLAVACARVLATRGTTAGGRILDIVLLAAVALPGIVFAAGYIFTYNLPQMNAIGIHIYGTNTLLLLAYLATALPSTTRLLVGTMSQLQESMSHAARVHGRGSIRTWLSITLPVISRPLLSAWLLTYSATLLELPVSQLLAPPGSQPISVGISNALGKYDYGGGTAMEVLAILSALAVVAIGYGGYRLLAPAGWRKVGATR
ncbi:MAG: iron(III) transport system permease protein [Microbacteriaceae bacterium]|nr:iron(III) transport system permease protein [Microbacteriaceae bacterium]